MSRTVARGLTALAVTGLASFGLAGVALADTTCGYAGQPACLPATANKSVVVAGQPVSGTAGPVEGNETGPEILAPAGGGQVGAGPIGVATVTGHGAQAAGHSVAARHLGISRVAVAPVTLGTYQADAAGIIHYTVTIPKSTAAGRYTLNFPGHLPNGTAVTYFVPITVKGTGSGGGLPFTGAEIGIASAIGVGLLGAGTLAVVASRRRRNAVTA